TTSNGIFIESPNGGYYNNKNINNENTDYVGSPTTNFWTETVYDQSALMRVSEVKSPGVSTGIRSSYRTNQNSVHGTIKWYYINNQNQLAESTYSENSLNVVEVKDEENKKVEEFTDHNGRMILKRV